MKKLIVLLVVGLCLPVFAGAANVDYYQVNEDGFGDTDNKSSVLLRLNGKLYAAAENEAGIEVYRKAVNSDDWTEVNPLFTNDAKNVRVSSIMIHKNKIVIALENEDGAEVWATHRGRAAAWKQVNENGFGDTDNDTITRFYKHRGVLYAATENDLGHVEIWATRNGLDWEQKSEDGLGHNITKINAARFIKLNDIEYYVVATEEGKLLATSDLIDLASWDVAEEFDGALTAMNKFKGVSTAPELYIAEAGDDEEGVKLWNTTDFANYEQLGEEAFSEDINNTRINRIFTNNKKSPWLYKKKRLLVRTVNDNGFQVWKSRTGENWSKILEDGLGDDDNSRMISFIRYHNGAKYDGMLPGTYHGRFGKYLSTYNSDTGTEVFLIKHKPFKPRFTNPEDGATITTEDLTLEGKAHPRAEVRVFLDDVYQGSAEVGDKGNWEYALTGLSEGEHTVKARSVFTKPGVKKSRFETITFTVDLG